MRTTMHNGRAGKDGAFRASHNDRDFDLEKADHIDQTRTPNNWTWHCYQKSKPGLTFEDAEKLFYEKTFSQSLEAKNERYRKNRHAEKVQTMDEYRTSKQGCPEETIWEIGKVGDTVPAAVLKKIVLAQINWEQKTFPNVKTLDVALHVDEEGAPHLHQRKVWVADSKDGKTVGQGKALKEMGLERPDMSKKEGRYNNAKISYTERCREHFQSLCKAQGLDIETVPKEASETGLSLLEYKRREEEKKLEEAKARQKQVNEDTDSRIKAVDDEISQKWEQFDRDIQKSTEEAKKSYKEWEENKLKELRGMIRTVNKKREAVETRERAVEERERGLTDRETNIDKKQARLDATEAKLEQKMDTAYWDIEKWKDELKTASMEELERRNSQYQAGDFGEAVKAVDQLVGQQAKGLSF